MAKVHQTAEGNKIRIYSINRGSNSFISCTGGTLQPFVIFNDIMSERMTYVYQGDCGWNITVPETGILRFEDDPSDPNFTDITNLRIGDYVVINGPQFSSDLWGTHEIVNVDYVRTSGVDHKYFDIEA